MGFEASEASLVEISSRKSTPSLVHDAESRYGSDTTQASIEVPYVCRQRAALLAMLNSLRDSRRLWTVKLKKALRGPPADQYSLDGPSPWEGSPYLPDEPEPSMLTLEECEDALGPVGHLAELAGSLNLNTEQDRCGSTFTLPLPRLYSHHEAIRPRSWHGPAPRLPPIQEHDFDMQDAIFFSHLARLPRRPSYYSQVTA